MTKHLFGARSGLALVLTATAASTLHAQQPQQRPAELDSIVRLAPVSVTALRTPLQMSEVPYSVSVNSEREISLAKPGLSVEEALRIIPGVQVENRSNYALGERISIRGFGARSQFGVRGVRMLVDGIPATLPDGQSSLTYVDVQSLGRVEVVRGPAAALYGNTAGGVIQMETKQPPAVPAAQELGVTAGSDGLLRLRTSTSGTVDRTDYQLNFSRLDSRGYRQFSDSEVMYLNGRVGYTTERDRLRLIIGAGNTDAQNPGSLTDSLQKVDRFQAYQGNINAKTGKTILEGLAGLSWQHDADAGNFEAATYVSGRNVVNPIPSDIIDLDRLGGGVRALFHTNPFSPLRVQLSVGAEADRQRDDRQEFANVAGENGALRVDQRESVNNVGVFGQLSSRLTSKLSLLGALRYDWFRFEAQDHFLSNGDDSGKRTLDALSPTVGLTFALTEDLHLYGNIGKTFETPTTVELGNQESGAGGLNPDLEPQEALSYEIGTRTMFGNRVALQVAGFYSDVTNSLIPFQNEAGRTYYTNAGSATHRGVEVGATVVPVRGVTLQGAYTWTDAEFDEFGTASGNKIPGVAPHRVEAALTLAPAGAPGFIAIENRNVSKIAVNDANSAFSPSYNITEIRAGLNEFRVGSLALEPFAGLSNVFDREYNASLAVNAFGQRFYEAGAPRSFYVGGNMRFARD
ncbi:MAG: TonB-dependent receptor [Gemmatimonadota bacterium]|jgi:iron complex outermembrane receptor protein|nr:TonB-dependent receptor [Gemmatimonadota bacterium]